MSELISRAMLALREAAPEGFFVGGCVRDWLLGRPLKDLDVAVPEGVEKTGRRTADVLGGVFFWLRKEMNVARVIVREIDPVQIDIVPLAGSLHEDLRRRDFTINAMAVSARIGLVPGAPIVDPTGGQEDLAGRRLRLASPNALEEDPLRCLRAFRLGAALGLTLDPSLEPALRAAGPGLRAISGERIRDELFVLLEGEQTARVMAHLLSYQLVAPWSPPLAASAAGAPVGEAAGRLPSEVPPAGISVVRALDRWLEQKVPEHPIAGDLISTLGTAITPPRSRRSLTRLAALSISAGPEARDIALSLCLSADETRVVTRAVRGAQALRQGLPEKGRDRLRFSQRFEPGAVEAALLTTAARQVVTNDLLGDDVPAERDASTRPSEAALVELLGDLLERRLRPKPPLLTGEEVMAILQIAPGPEVGRQLQEIEERRADGWLRTADEAREWLRERRQ